MKRCFTNFVLASEQRKRDSRKESQLRFSLYCLGIFDVLYPGLVLNDLVLQNLANYTSVLISRYVWFFVVLYLGWNLLKMLKPTTIGDDYVFLPGHPLSEKKQQESERRFRERQKLNQSGFESMAKRPKA